MTDLSNYMNRVRSAARVALDRTNKITSGSTDTTLKIYQKLQPVHFDVIAQVYGQDNLLKYIKTMEAKKLRGNSNG